MSSNKTSPYYDYWNFCARQRQRKIDVEISSGEWLQWWVETGKLAQRGWRDDQYCMARIDKKDTWNIDNIECITNKVNRALPRK